jgi:hypothetical protein
MLVHAIIMGIYFEQKKTKPADIVAKIFFQKNSKSISLSHKKEKQLYIMRRSVYHHTNKRTQIQRYTTST